MTTTDKLLAELNALRGVKYPEIGYCYFADVSGNGDNRKSVYQVIGEHGGVSSAWELNDRNARKRCDKIRAAIAKEKS